MKRLFDILVSGCGLIFLSPLFLVLAIWIKLDSKGPVFYCQVRVGKRNKDFRHFVFCGCIRQSKSAATSVADHLDASIIARLMIFRGYGEWNPYQVCRKG